MTRLTFSLTTATRDKYKNILTIKREGREIIGVKVDKTIEITIAKI